ncbi:hypothetical protein ACS0TY_005156 [Phlomoides rotata]
MVGEAQTSNPNPYDPHNSSLQTRRRSCVVIPENFPVGTEVEVRTDEEGFKFVYFTAKVISPPALTKSQSPTKKVGRKKSAKKSDKETSICLEVEYHNLLASNKGRDRLREILDIPFVRPVPPVQEIDKGFEPGDVVDAYYKDGWWQGVVAEVVEDGGKFVVSFHDPPDLECALKNLRYHWDWVDGSWVRPYKENMSGLMFQVGREVEVSFDREESQDAWFPASIHEDLGNGFFRVEYMNKNGEAVKTTVDSLHVRPCPPLLKDTNFVLLEKVDAYFDYCWWSGVITKELENSRYIVFFKPMKQDREIYQSKLRPHMEWKEGKWFTSSQEASLQSLDDGVHEHHFSENASATVAAAPVKNSVNGKDTCDGKTLTSLTSTKDQVEQLTPDNQKMSHTNTSLKKRRRYLTDSGAIQSLPPKKPKEGNVAVTKPQDKTGEERIKEVLCGFVSPDSASNTDTSAMQTTEDHPAFDHSWEKKIQRKQRNDCSKQNSSGMITPTPCSMKNNKTNFKSQTLDIRGEVLGAAENYLEDVQNEHANEELEVPIIIGLPCFEAGSPGISGGRKSQGFKIKEVATIVNDQEPPLINSSILKDNMQPGTRESSERRKRGWPKRTPVESTQTPVSGKSQNGNVATFDLNKKDDLERSHEIEVIEMESMLSNQKTEVNKEKVADGLPYPKNKRVRTKKRTSPSVHKEKGMEESVELGENLLLKKKGRKMTAVQVLGEAQTSNPNPHDPHNSSLQTRRRSGVVIPENFPVGTEVEVRTDEEGFKFVYFTAKVISPPALTKSQSPTKKVGRKKSAKKSDKETSICLEVEYHNLLASNKGRDRLRETLDISFVRPVPPVQEIDKGFEPGDVVDAYYKDSWWQGVVAEVVEDGGKFVVSFHDPPDLECALKNLRYHWDWVDGSWVRPYKENMSGLMFEVGRKVEVSFDREDSQDAWFPASIHEDLGNGFFRVEYMNKNGEAVKTTVDSLHVRPCPPLLKDKNLVLLEKVDAYFDYCWWSGVITKELENSRYIVFFKPMKQDREIYQSKLRPHMEWKEGKWFTSSQQRKQRNVRSKQNSSGMITPTPCSMKNNKTIFKSQTLDIRGEVLGAAENYLEDVQNEHANEELEVPIIIGLPCFEAGSPGISGGRKSQGFKIKEVATIVNDQEPPLINSSILKDNMQPGTRESSERRKRGRPKRTPVESTQTPVSGMQWAKSIIVILSDDEEEVIQNLQLPSTNTTSSGQLEIQLQDPALGSEHLPSGDNTLSSEILLSFHLSQIQEPSIPPLDKGKKIIDSEPEKAKPPSSKGKRSATSESERVGKKSKKSSEHPSKERAKKDMVRTAANDIFTIELPKGLAELDQYGCVDFLHHLHTANDNFVYSSHTPEQVERAMAQKLCQFLALLSCTSKHSVPSAARELRDLLEKRDQEILQVTTDLTNATAEIEALKKQLAEEKVASKRVHSELENHFKTKAEELEKNFKAKEQELETRGFLRGLELCRKRIFRTVPGQSFLKDLHEGLISAYLKSTLFLSDLSPHIGHFVSHGFKSAVRQVRAKGVSRELTSSLDPMAVVETLKASPSFEGDENLPLDHPWWLPVMKRAVDKLVGSTFSDPQLSALDQVLYDLDSSEGTSSQEVSLLQDQNPDLDHTSA